LPWAVALFVPLGLAVAAYRYIPDARHLIAHPARPGLPVSRAHTSAHHTHSAQKPPLQYTGQAAGADSATTTGSNRSSAPASSPSSPVTEQDPLGHPLNPALLLMIKAASTGSWRAVENHAAAIARVAKFPPAGNRQACREDNKLGLAALRVHNFPKALSEFEKGVHDDPSDIEVANNYGYALALAGRKVEAQDTLTRVLLRDPAREVAWTDLVEARSDDSGESLAALKIALHFAASRERTLTNFRDLAQAHPDPRVRSLMKTLLEQSDQVPTVPEGQH